MRVAILDDIHRAYATAPAIRQLRERAEVHIFTQAFGSPAALQGFEALVANRERTHFTRDFLDQLPDLRILVQTGSHATHIDLKAAEERNIIVAKATGGFSSGAGELAIGLMLAVMRQIPGTDAAVEAGRWPMPMTRVLHGKALGIVGLGNVGRYVARIGNAFEMQVFAWSPSLSEATAAACGAQRLELDELLRRSDVVSIHAALNSQSRGLIGARRLALMQATAVLINTARGPIIDEMALCEALADERIAGAGLDVFTLEPLPPSHPLTRLSNVVLTSHIGWPTDEEDERAALYEGLEVGTFAADSAAVKLMRLDTDHTARALSIAASQSAGVRENFGTMTKPFHAGRACESGVVAAQFASYGWTATDRILEAPRGFFQAAGGGYDGTAIAGRLGHPWTFANPGVSIKPYPSGWLTHPGMTEMLRLITGNEIAPEAVRRVRVGTNSNMPNALIHHRPRDELQAKFSLEFCIAILLLERRARLREFTDATVRRPDVQDISDKFERQAIPVIGSGATKRPLDLAWRLDRLPDAGKLAQAAARSCP